jgi:RHS repeat-associated protein
VNYPFLTSKERDNETGLDYFLARYYSSNQGRFVSPDEFSGGPHEVYGLGKGDPEKQALPYADTTQPQSLNKYQYTYNNPVNNVDPDGHVCIPCAIVVAVIAIAMSPDYVNGPTLNPNEPRYPSGSGPRDLVSNIFIGEATGAFAQFAFSPIFRFAGQKLFAREAVARVESQVLRNAAQGSAFENEVLGLTGMTKNTTRVLQGGEATGAAYRVPDVIESTLQGKLQNVVGEIKSSMGTLRLTNQFKDLLKYASQTESTLKIYVRPGAKLDKKLTTALKEAGAEVYDVANNKIVRRLL